MHLSRDYIDNREMVIQLQCMFTLYYYTLINVWEGKEDICIIMALSFCVNVGNSGLNISSYLLLF